MKQLIYKHRAAILLMILAIAAAPFYYQWYQNGRYGPFQIKLVSPTAEYGHLTVNSVGEVYAGWHGGLTRSESEVPLFFAILCYARQWLCKR